MTALIQGSTGARYQLSLFLSRAHVHEGWFPTPSAVSTLRTAPGSPFNLQLPASLLSQPPLVSPPTIIRVVALRYTSLSRNYKTRYGKTMGSSGKARSRRNHRNRGRKNGSERKEGGRGVLGKMDGPTITLRKR